MARRPRSESSAPQSSLLTPTESRVLEHQAGVSQPAAEKPLALVDDVPRRSIEPGPIQVIDRERTPTDMLLEAIGNPNLDMAKLEKLMDLQDRWVKEAARKAFIQAMVRFKAKVPAITKNRRASIEKNGQKLYDYEFADLPAVLSAVIPALASEGFSHGWKMKQQDGMIIVTCVLSHAEGHIETAEMFAMYDTSGGKNAIQAIASANSYLQRYTVLAICGLSTASGEDDDGKASGNNPGLEPIDAEQLQKIKDILEEMDAGATKGLLDYLKVETLEEIPLQAYELAIDALGRRKKARGG